MHRTSRLFDLIQIFRTERKAITADQLAARLDVSSRTIYRDIQTLQSMRIPIDGEAGIGYLMRQGYDLPPLNFSQEEIEAIVVGLSLVEQTGDRALYQAALRVTEKIDRVRDRNKTFHVSDRGVLFPQSVNPEDFRYAIREEQKIDIDYIDENGQTTHRRISPLAIIYYVHAMLLVAWCELRCDHRHFRIDRITHCEPQDIYFKHEGDSLRQQWQGNS
jgi:predicted DNA-binding transcriptional regulator YafY